MKRHSHQSLPLSHVGEGVVKRRLLLHPAKDPNRRREPPSPDSTVCHVSGFNVQRSPFTVHRGLVQRSRSVRKVSCRGGLVELSGLTSLPLDSFLSRRRDCCEPFCRLRQMVVASGLSLNPALCLLRFRPPLIFIVSLWRRPMNLVSVAVSLINRSFLPLLETRVDCDLTRPRPR